VKLGDNLLICISNQNKILTVGGNVHERRYVKVQEYERKIWNNPKIAHALYFLIAR
jgi:hypothetical protein